MGKEESHIRANELILQTNPIPHGRARFLEHARTLKQNITREDSRDGEHKCIFEIHSDSFINYDIV